MVGNQEVEQTPGANLTVANHELDRLPQTPEVLKVRALLKAAQVQVNQLRNEQASSHSMASAHPSHRRSVGRQPHFSN